MGMEMVVDCQANVEVEEGMVMGCHAIVTRTVRNMVMAMTTALHTR